MADQDTGSPPGRGGGLLRIPCLPAGEPPATGQTAPQETSRTAASGTVTLVERTIVVMLSGGLVLGVLLVLKPLATALLFGAILAIATWPLRRVLVRSGLGRVATAVLMLLASLLLVGLPLLATAPRLATQLADGAHRLEGTLSTLSVVPPDWVVALPLGGGGLGRAWQQLAGSGGDLRIALEPYAEWIRNSMMVAAAAMADSVLQFVLALIVAAMFWANGDTVGDILRDVVRRLGGEMATKALDAAGGSLRSVAYGVVGTAFIQGVFMTIGAAISGLPAPGLLGFLVMLLAISQIGAPLIVLVWGGGAWWLFRLGEESWGIFMLVWGFVLVSASDNLIRPLLIRQGVAMPLTLVILGVFGGFLSFGFLAWTATSTRAPAPAT